MSCNFYLPFIVRLLSVHTKVMLGGAGSGVVSQRVVVKEAQLFIYLFFPMINIYSLLRWREKTFLFLHAS